MSLKKCRFCSEPLEHIFIDLGVSPLANSYLKKEDLARKECFYPLQTYVCDQCYLVQLEEFESPEHIFEDYAYFSSFSNSWLEHCEEYAEMATKRFNLNSASKVIEIASNDGYLLQYFMKLGIPVLGIEPAKNVAERAIQKGIPTEVNFFETDLAHHLQKDHSGDLIIANNVLAHVPDIHRFVGGLKILLNENGTITAEFPHLMQLISENQFDTIYHEHFSYYSLTSISKIFQAHHLEIYDVEELQTHGGSLRIYAKHAEDNALAEKPSVALLKEREKAFGICNIQRYKEFSNQIKLLKGKILKFLITAMEEGKTVAGYGAPAKGNTLLNYCGVGPELISFTVDRNPYKQGLYLPGTRIPIRTVDDLKKHKPDYVVILPWNLKGEIMDQLNFIKDWNGQFVFFVPSLEVM